MRDEGLVTGDEPFHKLLMLGMVLQDGKKMSKSAGDAGDPQKLLDKYGADCVRTAMMFAAPPDQSFEWSEAGLEGAARFLKKLWGLVQGYVDGAGLQGATDSNFAQLGDPAAALRRKAYETLARADDDLARRVQFNTVVSGVMELANEISKFEAKEAADQAVLYEVLRIAVIVISPIAPHIAQSLWEVLGEPGLLVEADWPDIDETALVQSKVSMVVQVNGKVRAQIEVAADAQEADVLSLARAQDNVAKHAEGKQVVKEIVVPNKLVNIVVR